MSQFFKTKEATQAWLDVVGIKGYTINDDLKVDVDGDVRISDRGITHFPVRFGAVSGHFICSENKLATLEGAPHNVGKDFDCSVNHLTSLKGAPKDIRGDFYCSMNQLATLDGAPDELACSFYCNGNQLTSLEGAPHEVGGIFECTDNELTSLKGGPKHVGKSFNCDGNQLTTLASGPEVVEGLYTCENNNLTSLDGIPTGLADEDSSYVRGAVYCSNNPLRDVGVFREHIGGFKGPSAYVVETIKVNY